jgi:vitamin B12 transporter
MIKAIRQLRRGGTTAIAITIVAASPLSGQTDSVKLKAVIVSATVTPTTEASAPQPVTVITGAELRRRGIARVSDALRDVPGAMIASNGSVGSVTSLFLRGGESRYVKVLIDNVPVNSAGGAFDFSHLTTDNVDRIEVVRGPASVIYGADAVSGVVRIFTRRGSGRPSLELDARAGTYKTNDMTATVSGSAPRASFSLAGARHATDGLYPFNNDYYNGTLSGFASMALDSKTDATMTSRYTAAEFHYPTDYTGAPVDSNAFRVQHRLVAGAELTRRLSGSFQVKVSGASNDVRDYTDDVGLDFDNEQVHSRFSSVGYRRSVDIIATSFLPVGATLSLGTGYQRERESSRNASGSPGDPLATTSTFAAARTDRSAYGELAGALGGRVDYTMSGRFDDHSDFGRFTTYRAAANVSLTSFLRARASIASAFNAPSFSQLHETLYTEANPDLDPERARSIDVGVELMPFGDVTRVSIGHFDQTFLDMIQYIAGGPPSYRGSYGNLAEARARGYQAEVTFSPARRVFGSASYTWVTAEATRVDPASAGGLAAGEALLRRPSHSGTAKVGYLIGSAGSVDVGAVYVGKRPDLDFAQFPSPMVTLPSYMRADVGGVLNLSALAGMRTPISITLRVENVFDRQYEDVLHFRSPGRTVLVGAKITASR